MKTIIYFKWKFLPDWEHRKIPNFEEEDSDNLYKLYAWRQELRLYYLSWRNVWYTYKYLLRFIPLVGLIVFGLSGSYIAAGIVVFSTLPLLIFINRKIESQNQMRFFIPGIVDAHLTPIFGSLPPFAEEEENEE